jgi:DNA polymerase III gamma/tau subunit
MTADELDIASGHHAQLEGLAQRVSLIQVERMAQILGKTASQIAWSSLPRFVLEMAAVRMTKLDQLARVEATLLERASEGGAEAARHPVESRAAEVAPPDPYDEEPAPEPVPPPRVETERAMPVMSSTAAWKGFVDAVMKKRPLLGALLTHADYQIETEGGARHFLLAFPEGSFFQRQACDTKNRTEIEELLKAYFGRETRMTLSSGSENTMKSIEQTNQAEAAELKKSALEHPTVVKMKEILGAEVIDVKVEI